MVQERAEEPLEGGCLCGAVRYRITGHIRRFFHCHCRRCRKATGTGHASNVILMANDVEWTAGEVLLSRYKVPEAERFATCFCSKCGSLLPRVGDVPGVVVIPAGSLDTTPSVKPQARIFWDSRVSWSCSAGESLPTCAEYP